MGWQQKFFSRQSLPRVVPKGELSLLNSSVWYSYWRDPYHLLLTMPWLGFGVLVVLINLSVNGLFALAYLAGGDGIANARSGSFLDAFFFSVQTLASIGYGAMYPRSSYVNTVVTIESLVGLLGVALVAGLAFARFSRPTARVIFSRVAVVTPYEGIPALMFRTANQRRNQILEAQMRVYLLRDEVSLEGKFMRRLYSLKLLRSQTSSFALTWTAIHPIDKESALYGTTPESLAHTNAQIVVSLSGIDETVYQAIHARYLYKVEDILWNWQLVDIIDSTPNGDRYIDFSRFHDAVPVEA